MITSSPKIPTVIEQPSEWVREGARAQWWRINVAHMTVQELADQTGYGVNAIYYMERGISSTGRTVQPWAWQRYKMACAGVHAFLLTVRDNRPEPFNWGRG